jgi:membrane-bound metal-dependent hydrolase YbcI (DUF457 family)
MTHSLNGPYRFATYAGTAIGAWILIGVVRQFDAPTDGNTLRVHGILDELGHLLTALMIAMGIKALRFPVPVWSILIGGVLLDVGHIMLQLDFTEPIEGSSRNGTHSVFALILLACVGFFDQRRANVWLGVTLGALSHLWRDMGTGNVPLVWPFLENVDGTTFARYMIGLLGATIAMIGSGALLEVYANANALDERQSTEEARQQE